MAGKSGTRILKLSEKAHSPKPIQNYKDAQVILNQWETDLKDFAKLVGQDLAPLTKMNTVLNMVPVGLRRELEKDKKYQSFDEAWKYVLE